MSKTFAKTSIAIKKTHIIEILQKCYIFGGDTVLIFYQDQRKFQQLNHQCCQAPVQKCFNSRLTKVQAWLLVLILGGNELALWQGGIKRRDGSRQELIWKFQRRIKSIKNIKRIKSIKNIKGIKSKKNIKSITL